MECHCCAKLGYKKHGPNSKNDNFSFLCQSFDEVLSGLILCAHCTNFFLFTGNLA